MSNMIFGAGGGKPKPPKRTADTLVADDTVEILLAISEGKIVGLRNKTNPEKDFFVAGTPVQGVSGDWNYEGFVVEQYPGDPVGTTPVHMTLGGFAENVNVNVPLATGSAVVRQTSTGQIDAIDVRLRIDALYEQNEKGIFEDTFVYSIRYRAQGSSTWLMALPPASGETIKSKFTGKTTRPYPFEVRIPVDRIAVPYEIQVIMYNDDNDTENVVSATWESFQEIDNEPRTYPGTALIRFLGKATDQFTSIPLLEGIYEGRIVNVPVTYNTTTKTYSGTWDGTFKEAFTDETVWILADLITNPRYGYQRYNPNVSVDWPSFYATALKANQLVSDGNGGQRRRHTFNGVISEARPGKQALLYVAGTMNCTIYDDGQGKLYLAMDSNDAVEQVFVPENVTEDGFNYSFTDVNVRYNQITGTFINPAVNWEPDRRLRSVQADIDANGVVPYDFLAVGCTNEAELLAAINYKLLTSLTEKIQVNFRTTRAGYLTRPYGVVGIGDINMGWGIHGRIKSTTGSDTINLRDPVYFETTGIKAMTVQGKQGPVNVNINVTATGYTSTLTRSGSGSVALSTLPENAAFVIGEVKPFRVMKVTEVEGQPDLYDIFAMEMNRDKYGDMLEVDIDELIEGSNIDRLQIAPPTNVVVDVVWTPTSNGLTPKFNISWDRSTTRGVRSYVVYASRNGEPDQLVGSTTGSGYEWLSPLSGYYKISVMARSFLGTQSMPAYATDLDFTNPTPVAGFNPSGVQVDGGGTTFVGPDPTFVWDPVDPAQLRATEVEGTPTLTDLDDPMLRDYRVRIKTTADVVLRTEYVDQPRYTYYLDKNVQDGGPRRSFKVGVSVRDRFGAFSNESVITVSNPVPAVPAVSVSKFFGGFELKFTPPDDKDFRGYQVWMSTSNGFTPGAGNLVFDGAGNATITGTSNGTYYFRYAAYDEFGKTGLTVSTQQTVVLDRLVDLFDTGPDLNDKFDEIETAISDLETVYGDTVSAAASATAAATSAANAAASQASAASAQTAAEAAQALAESAKTAAQSAQTAAAASQSAAASSASAAATSATNASTANTNAQTAKTNAETAATNAASANTLAQAAKTAAETAATNSAASATAASGYATTASTAATNASTANTAAQAAKVAAETANTNAQAAKTAAQSAQTAAEAAATAASGSATVAAGHATTASSEADEAAGSASAASASAVVARTTLAGMFPSEMAQNDQWTGSAGGSPASIASENSGNFTTVAGIGTVWQSNTTNDNLFTRGVFTPVSGRVYEFEALVRGVAANTSGTAPTGSLRARSLDDTYTTGPANYTPTAMAGFINGYSGSNSGHSTSWTIWKARWTAPASGLPAYIRPELYVNVGPGNQQMQVAYFKITDVSSQSAAEGSASAAATSASGASISATNAGNSASAASTSATNAATSAGAASTSAGAASTSATNAASSASTATTQANLASTSATNAANSATAAGGSATAAAGSATTAGTHATNAGNSATAAAASALTAKSVATSILPDLFDTDDYWSAYTAGAVSAKADTAYSVVSDADFGFALEVPGSNATGLTVQAKQHVPVIPGRKYEITVRLKMTVAPTDGTLNHRINIQSLNADLTANGSRSFNGSFNTAIVGEIVTFSRVIDCDLTTDLNAASAFFTYGVQIARGTETGSPVTRLGQVSIKDVSAREAAANSASAAATSASGAATSASGASTSASAAASSATTAATQAGLASTSAGQASTSASQAATSASTATTQANTATTQATAAAGSATAAGGSATAAAGSATAAATSATAAGNSATSAAASEVSARSAASSVLPSGMASNNFWIGSAGGDPATATSENIANFTTVSGIGPVWQSNAASDALYPRGVLPAIEGRTYRVEVRLRALAANTSGNSESGVLEFMRLDDTYTNLGNSTGSAVGGFNSSYSGTSGLGTSWVVWKRDFTVPASPAYSYLRPRVLVNNPTGNQQVQIQYFLIRDLTEQLSAASFADAAASSASSASTSQTAAGSSASAAATSATNAATSAGAASTSAGAASTSATNAANSASTATTQANNASTSATAAAGSATAAGGSATAAAGSASAAATSATNAGNSASAANASAVSARSVAVRMLPERVSDYDNFTTQTAATPDAATSISGGSVVNDGTEGDVYSAPDLLNFYTKGVLAVGTGQTFKVTLRTKVTTNGTSNQIFLGFQVLGGDYSNLGAVNFTAVDSNAVVADGWQEFTATVTSAQALAISGSAVYLRARARINGNSGGTDSGAQSSISVLRFENTTVLTTAQGSADAAATSATAAGTSATAAGTSAGAASTSATNAATSAGAASTSAGAAATSATNAATSATTATTQANAASTSATAAAGSATAAGGSATAAAGSASSAATSATNAGNSASAADASYIAARSQAATLVPSDFTNQAQWITAVNGDPATAASEGSGNFTTVSGVGAVWQSNAASDTLAPRGLIAAPVTGRRYRIEVTFRALAINTGGSITTAIAVNGLDSTFANTGAQTLTTVAGSSYTDTSTAGAPTSWTTFKADYVVPGSPPAYARPRFFVNSTTGNQQVQVSSFIIRDITEMTAAQGSADAASTSASNASTSATNAGNSATAAAGSATTASTQAGLASASAGAASTSASNAAASASTATTQANTATTQATNAANSATAAGGSATAASGSASSAATSATNAGNSASSAAASAVTAQSTAISLLPDTFETTFPWSASTTGAPSGKADTSYSVVADSDFGYALEVPGSNSNGLNIHAKQHVAVIPGRKYEITARVKMTTAPGDGALNHRIIIQSLTDALASAGSRDLSGSFNTTTAGTVVTYTMIVNCDLTTNLISGAKFFVFGLNIARGTETGSPVTRIGQLAIRDVSGREGANAAASAAATSASAAATSATSADTSATSATNSANTATTQAGNASSSAGAAATSATTAAGSATTAGTHATNAANSATAAGGSATAAAGSASTAATAATNAGNSANAAETSRIAARSTASTLLPSSMYSNEVWSPTSGTGDPASVTAVTDANFSTDGTYGRVYTTGTGSIQWLSPRGVITAVAGRTYQAEVLLKANAANTAGAATADGRLRFRRLNGDFTAENTANGTNPAGFVSTVPSTTTGVPTSWTVWKTYYTVPASPTFTYLRPELFVNNASGNQVVKVAYFLITDITEVTAASGFADAASTSASAAGTSATNAGNSASAAATSATNASTSAGAASTSAGAASTSATNAATSASTATTQANNASTSAGAAATSATNAGNSATAASGSASAAATSATAAGNSATSSEASNISAKSVANRLLPDRPSVAQDFMTSVTGDPATASDIASGTVVSVAGEGDVRQFTSLTYVYTKGVRAVGTNRTFRLTVRARTAVNGTNGRLRTTFHALDNTYTNLGAVTVVTQDASWVVADGWQEFTQVVTSAQLLAVSASAAYVRPHVYMNENTSGTDSGATTQLAFMRFEDISSEQAAADSATAAATSATAASTSATTAGTQAGVATTQASNASTSASTASTQATNAASSATAAAGSATSASTYASNAATSATNAGTSATNASTSATNASNSAASAAASATLAAQVGNMAINPNPYFADYTTTPGLPGSWVNWNGTTSTYTRITGIMSPYGVNIPGAAGANVGIRSPTMMPALQKGWNVIEAVVKLVSGTFVSSGVLLQVTGTGAQTASLKFDVDPDLNGDVAGNGTTGKVYRFSKLVQITSTAESWTAAYIYAMSHYNTFGSNASANSIDWHACYVRPATAGEIETGIARGGSASLAEALTKIVTDANATYATASALTTLTSTVNGHTSSISTLSSTQTTLDGKMNALYNVDVSTSSSKAGFVISAGAVSYFDAYSDRFRIYDGTSTKVPVFEVVGGVVKMKSLQVPTITASMISVTSLSAITATIGTLRTATSGARTEIKDNLIEVYDSSNVLRVKIGVW